MNVPSVGYSRLKNTALIQVVGKDANKFLNGLITSKFTGTNTEQYANDCLINDNSYYINKSNYLDNSENHGYKKVGQYSLCLNATGKLFSDLWVYPFQLFNKKIETAPFFEKDYVYDQNYLIEVNGTVAKQLYALFKTHKLASKVRLKHLRDDMFSSWYFYNDVDPYFTEQLWKFKQNWLKNNRLLSDPETAQNLLLEFVDSKQLFSSNDIDYLSQHLYGLAFDERSPSRLGLKLLTSHDVSPLRLLDPSKLAKDPSSFKKVSSEQLRSRRILNDLAEVSISELEPNKYLPLELNYNLMGIVNGGYDEQYEDYLAKLDEQEELAENDENYTKEEISEVKYNLDNSPVISFNKGCYIGQELTHRTFFRGVIRKRVLPLKLSLSNDESVLDNEALVTKILAAGIDDKHVYYEEHVPKGEAEENVKQDQTLSSNNPFGSSTPRRRKKPYVGALLHIQGNFAVGTINLPEYTKAHREFFIKVKISDPIKKSLSEEEIKSLSIVNNEIRLYIEGFVPEWFPEGWLDELD